MKKMTLLEIIARRKQGDMDKMKIKYYESKILGCSIEIRKIPLKRYFEIVQGVDEDESIDSMNEMLFEFCPMFRENSTEAMEAYGVEVPTDLPAAILEDNLGEMNEMLEIINSFYGGADKSNEQKSEEIKNSSGQMEN